MRIEGAASRQASAYLDPPQDMEPIADAHFRTALALRMGDKDPARAQTRFCQNYTVDGKRRCNAPCHNAVVTVAAALFTSVP